MTGHPADILSSARAGTVLGPDAALN
jgi:hypothetical protein